MEETMLSRKRKTPFPLSADKSKTLKKPKLNKSKKKPIIKKKFIAKLNEDNILK